MKKIYIQLFLFLIFCPNLYANENIIEFRLAFESERPNTEIIFDKDVGRLFVEKVPFLTLQEISKVNLIVDDSEQPAWLEKAAKSSGSKIIKPQIKFELLLNESGRNIIKQITSENVGKRAAIFVDGNCEMAPAIQGEIDSDRFYITTGLNENEARELVDVINNSIFNK